MNFGKRFNLSVIMAISIWGILFIIYGGFQNLKAFSTICELILDIIVVILSWKIYKISSTENRRYFLILFISYLAILFANIDYGIIFYVIKHGQLLPFKGTLYFLPYLIYIICQTIFWLYIVIKHIIKPPIQLISLSPFLFASAVIMVIYIIVSLWVVKHFTYIIRFEMLNGGIDLIIADLVILALICSRNKGLYFLALSTILSVATNFWWMYLFHNESLGVVDYSASFWLLSIVLRAFALFYIFSQHKLELSTWFGSLLGIKSQVTLWTFSLSIISFLILFFLGYAFNLIGVMGIVSLPFLSLIYSVIIILISNYVGKKFEKPFKQIKTNIKMLMNDTPKSNLAESNFSTEEFSFLQKFITNTFNVYEERNKEKKAIADLALQVAHDIRSPVAAILMLSKECIEIPENQRIAMRDAANRIQDIANYMLNQYENKQQKNSESNYFLVSTALLSVLSEKKVEYKTLDIIFSYQSTANSHFSFIKIDQIEFKRMISNLINNAVEAITDKGQITIKLIREIKDVLIKIIDNGSGMDETLVQKITSGDKIHSSKTVGHGLGLSHAMTILKKNNAKLNIASDLGQGTTITLAFKAAPLPIWIADKINLYENDNIIILDDDSSIHAAWDKLFSTLVDTYKNLRINHFIKADKCIEYINKTSAKENLLILADYELIKQKFNGLDVIEMSGIERSILVTSHYENMDIIKRAILLKTMILPKTLVSEVSLNVQNNSKYVSAKPNTEEVDLVLLEDNHEFADVLSYLYESKGKKIRVYNTAYELLRKISSHEQVTKICVDYDLNSPVTGIDIAKLLYKKGYRNLYLATGFTELDDSIPEYLCLLKEKMDLLNL